MALPGGLLADIETGLKLRDRTGNSDGIWYRNRLTIIPDPNPNISEEIGKRLNLPVSKPPIYALDRFPFYPGTYTEFADAICLGLEPTPDAQAHELGHHYFWRGNAHYRQMIFSDVGQKVTLNPTYQALFSTRRAIKAVIPSATGDDLDMLLRSLVALSGRISLLLTPPYHPTLVEGFATWAGAKLYPPKNLHSDYDHYLSVFTGLEERLGESKTLEIALTVTSDQALLQLAKP